MMSLKDLKIITKDLGLIILIIAAVLLIPIPVALYYSEWQTVDDFLFASLITAVVGSLCYFPIKPVEEMRLKHSIALTVLFWPVASFFGAIPLFTTGSLYTVYPHPSFLDCYFDSMSGWTTTGLSVLQAFADDIPNSVHIWRALMQFIGGLGIILISIMVLSRARTGSESISLAATELTPSERFRPSIINTAKSIIFLFLGFLVVVIVMLIIVGMPVFDAFFHAMTGLSLGGFSTNPDSIGGFQSTSIELATLVIMFIASTNFAVHIAILSGNFKELFKNIESRTFLILLILFSTIAAIWIFNRAPNGIDELESVRRGFYQVMSGLTSTGWMNVDPDQTLATWWAPMGTFLLIICMIIGGSTSSASGGLRLARFALIMKSIWWHVKKSIMPGSVVFPRTYHHIVDKRVTDNRMMDIYIFASIYIFTIIASTLIISTFVEDFEQAFFECTSAVSVTGMSSGLTDITLHSGAKITLIIDMWIGRVEIIPLLMFFASLSRRIR